MEVKEAFWLDDSTKETTFRCSNCGQEPLYEKCKNNKFAFTCLSLYCPHCGCEMKLQDEED